MTIDELVKRFQLVSDKEKMCLHSDDKNCIGWDNLEIIEKENAVYFIPSKTHPFNYD